jgi:transposase
MPGGLESELSMPIDGPKRVFSDEFKREAVRLAKEHGNVEQTARELGIHSTVLHRWKRRLATAPENERAFPGHGNPKDPELVRLQRELARVKEENEILKKAVGIFSIRPL